jgi:hypothetical protein
VEREVPPAHGGHPRSGLLGEPGSATAPVARRIVEDCGQPKCARSSLPISSSSTPPIQKKPWMTPS